MSETFLYALRKALNKGLKPKACFANNRAVMYKDPSSGGNDLINLAAAEVIFKGFQIHDVCAVNIENRRIIFTHHFKKEMVTSDRDFDLSFSVHVDDMIIVN